MIAQIQGLEIGYRLRLLRLDADAGRVTAVEVADTAAELLAATAGEVRHSRDEREAADEFSRECEKQIAAYRKGLRLVFAALSRSLQSALSLPEEDKTAETLEALADSLSDLDDCDPEDIAAVVAALSPKSVQPQPLPKPEPKKRKTKAVSSN